MAKRRRDNGRQAQQRRSKEGRGIGTGADYLPYLFIHDVPSIGLASRVWGWKARRVHHLLSRLELKFFYTLEWRLDVIDIREQFPLDLDETLAIADQLGVRHPRDPKTKDYVVMTSDFVITVRKDFVSEEQIRTVKHKKDLEDARVKEKLEIERVYWQEIRELSWEIVTEEHVDANVAGNVEWLHCHRDVERLAPLTAADIERVETLLTPRVAQGGFRLRDLTNECDARLGFAPGSSLDVVRHLLANRRWEIDMRTRIMPPLPLVLTSEPALYAAH
ncbi:MAG TPA: TnsA endonuclease N-terminal domain-containing protein [Pyrinomonadaceae bacterium]|nr:TnsA endonuclease N-terminal domain-containing protein [Pyrinomonadaceae bacterium]